jgi:sRNA-binding protein
MARIVAWQAPRTVSNEQAAAARRQAAEAEERSVRARQEQAVAEEHEAKAREIDPDADDGRDERSDNEEVVGRDRA